MLKTSFTCPVCQIHYTNQAHENWNENVNINNNHHKKYKGFQFIFTENYLPDTTNNLQERLPTITGFFH